MSNVPEKIKYRLSFNSAISEILNPEKEKLEKFVEAIPLETGYYTYFSTGAMLVPKSIFEHCYI